MSALVKVWDPFVRSAHWLIALGFLVAYLSEGEPLWLHSWAGYLVAAVVVLRILWGFVGTRYARFSDFVYAPSRIVAYLFDLLRLRSKRYLGHSPAGGAMTLALLLALAATTVTGMATLAQDEGKGPLTFLVAQTVRSPEQAVAPARGDDEEGDEDGGRGHGIWKDLHELATNLTLALVLLHLGGVALASLAHRENLPRAMVTGRKRRD
ncbi:Cytochrome b [Tistlia consotensis]|uniref:Cytochrome b n=1 Tax=Tistlia consotensis USBA 355 TaxID=560819 RepID=A0A1Y6BND5_9PROT|nr:cytochrome b/b6 domain-containing protein [Tistlia consotensis]SMF12702.1 Cytochrome b [Tistlia consotensis USBA 355]SNR50940.1 Cytochrome b [Tistlia consotensis]